MSTALDALTAEQVEAAARALYARRVERGYPRNLSIPAPWWHQLTDRERDRFRDDALTVIEAMFDTTKETP